MAVPVTAFARGDVVAEHVVSTPYDYVRLTYGYDGLTIWTDICFGCAIPWIVANEPLPVRSNFFPGTPVS